MISMLAAFRAGALGNDCGRLQNGTASTGKLNHSNVREGKASNRVTVGAFSNPQGSQSGVYVGNCLHGKQRRTKTRKKKTAQEEVA
jgi:hypothetical protein